MGVVAPGEKKLMMHGQTKTNFYHPSRMVILNETPPKMKRPCHIALYPFSG